VNEGGRIDYVVIDKSLMGRVQRGGNLRCGVQDQNVGENYALTETAALRATTANGQYQPASFGGDGLQVPSKTALDLQFGEPHTGMIYTPPLFSDHIAISVLLDDSDGGHLSHILCHDASTRKAQPHKSQKSIASFFSGSATASGKKEVPAKSRPRFSKQSSKVRKKATILDHFQKK